MTSVRGGDLGQPHRVLGLGARPIQVTTLKAPTRVRETKLRHQRGRGIAPVVLGGGGGRRSLGQDPVDRPALAQLQQADREQTGQLEMEAERSVALLALPPRVGEDRYGIGEPPIKGVRAAQRSHRQRMLRGPRRLLQSDRLLAQGHRLRGVRLGQTVDSAHHHRRGSRAAPAGDDGLIVELSITDIQPVHDLFRMTADLRRVGQRQGELWPDHSFRQPLAMPEEAGRPTMIEEPGLVGRQEIRRRRVVLGPHQVTHGIVDPLCSTNQRAARRSTSRVPASS